MGPLDAPSAALTGPTLSRRAFLRLAGVLTAALALPASYAPRVARAMEAAGRVPVIWLHGQGCGGDSEAFLHASEPPSATLLLDVLSVEYDAPLMAAASGAHDILARAIGGTTGGYYLVVEGAVPQGADGTWATLAGRAYRDVLREASAGAIATIALGSCAFDGGVPGSSGGVTDATGVASVVPSDRLIALPGCPVNVENLTATIVHHLTFGQLPATDAQRRPLFAYGGLLHNQCERRAHFEFGEFALAWGDEGAQKGWCLYKMGCKGPETYANCPTVRYGDGTSWAVRAGHGCVGCTMPGSWDAMAPYYRRLPAPVPFAPHVTADQVGVALVAGIAGVTVVHGAASYVRSRRSGHGHAAGHGEPVVAAAAAGPTAATGPAAPTAATGPAGPTTELIGTAEPAVPAAEPTPGPAAPTVGRDEPPLPDTSDGPTEEI